MRTRLAIDIRILTIDGVGCAIGRLLEELSDSGGCSAGGHTVFVDAANQPTLRCEIEHAQQEIGSWMGPLLGEPGSSDPTDV